MTDGSVFPGQCRKDGAAFFAESTFWGVPAPDTALLAAAAAVKDFSQIRISECLGQ